jgi:hypothetical protein
MPGQFKLLGIKILIDDSFHIPRGENTQQNRRYQ